MTTMVKYEGLGLDNVWLENGYHWVETAHGRALVVNNVEALERAIARHVTEQSARLTGQARRFLREMLNMPQDAFGRTFGRDYQTVARWEAALHTPVPKGADAMMRQLYLEREGARPMFTHIVDKFETAAANAAEEPAVFFHCLRDAEVLVRRDVFWHCSGGGSLGLSTVERFLHT
jgi:DNA-binding transcriptional regulator YiaG